MFTKSLKHIVHIYGEYAISARWHNKIGMLLKAFWEMEHFPQCFQNCCATEALKGVPMRERVMVSTRGVTIRQNLYRDILQYANTVLQYELQYILQWYRSSKLHYRKHKFQDLFELCQYYPE